MEQLKSVRVCKRCGYNAMISENKSYSYFCNDCDEDLHEFETEIREVKNSQMCTDTKEKKEE